MKSIFVSFLLILSINFFSNAQIIDGFTDKQSYRAGETITFFVSGFNPFGMFNQIPLVAFDGSIQVLIPGFNNMTPQPPTTSQPWQDGFGYTATNTFTVPSSLKSGFYMLGGIIPVIIKGDNTTADIVVICPTNTINAYTTSGGNSLYTGVPVVSFLRPQSLSNYGHYDEGIYRWLKTSGMINNFNISFIADIDMDDYSEIANAKLLIVPGHSEYWTRKARINFDKYIDAGHDAMVLSGNAFWWQVRYEDDNYNSDNTKLCCYKSYEGANLSDRLLETIHWNEPTLKYSILGSIGADWLRGGIGVDCGSTSGAGNAIPCYGGFNGHRILIPQSPLLTNSNISPVFSYHDLLPFATGEYDGTLVITDMNGNALDANGNLIDNTGGDPILDLAALGFFRAELIGYDKMLPASSQQYTGSVDPNNTNITKYAPFMVFQKTCTSGTIINISSNEWCADWGIGFPETGAINPSGDSNCGSSSTMIPDSRIAPITANMINLMMQNQSTSTIDVNNGDNLFYSSRPTSPSFSMKPHYTTVSYNACTTGSIDITPCGTYITDGYKVDQGFTYNYWTPTNLNINSCKADIDANCTNYNMGLRVAPPNSSNDSITRLLLLNSIKNEVSQSYYDEFNKKYPNQNLQKKYKQTGITVYPNPNNGHFTLAVTNSEQINYLHSFTEHAWTNDLRTEEHNKI